MKSASVRAYYITPDFPCNPGRFRDHAEISVLFQHLTWNDTESRGGIADMARLLDQLADRRRPRVPVRLHYSIRTEDAHVSRTETFILLHGRRHPLETGGPEVRAFLTHLAV